MYSTYSANEFFESLIFSQIKGVFINGQMGKIKFKEMQLSNKAIIAFLNIEGSLKVTIDGL